MDRKKWKQELEKKLKEAKEQYAQIVKKRVELHDKLKTGLMKDPTANKQLLELLTQYEVTYLFAAYELQEMLNLELSLKVGGKIKLTRQFAS